MERFFTPTRRLQDRYAFELDFYERTLGYTEVKLAVSIEEFLKHRWDWSDFRAYATGVEGGIWKVLWITEDTFIWFEDEDNEVNLDQIEATFAMQCATCTAPSGETHEIILAKLEPSASLSAGASSVFWHAVATSNCVKLNLVHSNNRCFGLCSGPALLQFVEASPSLELLEFEKFAFKKAHLRALATLERTCAEVTFERCSFDAQDAEGTFMEWLRHSQVVTKLEGCTMEDSTISALSGNSSVKSLSINARTEWYANCRIIRFLARALAGNLGIQHLSVPLNEETYDLLLRSLWAHPRIQSVSFDVFPAMSAPSKTGFKNALLRLAQCNTVVHTIDLPHQMTNDQESQEFFQNAIVPRLEMNRSCFEDQRVALKRADPSIRGQLLGRALHVVRYNPDLLFRFLSENVPAFVRSDEDDPIIPSGRKRKAQP
jgi:hypothetical protein